MCLLCVHVFFKRHLCVDACLNVVFTSVLDLYCSVADPASWTVSDCVAAAELHRERLIHYGAEKVPSAEVWQSHLAICVVRFFVLRISGFATVGTGTNKNLHASVVCVCECYRSYC